MQPPLHSVQRPWALAFACRHATRQLLRCARFSRKVALKDGSTVAFEDWPGWEQEEQIQGHVEWENLRICTYNIFCRPPAPRFTHNTGNDFKDERLERFIQEHMDKYDVICLQEMFGAFSTRRRYVRECAKQKGFRYYASSPPARPNFLVDGGLLILSCVPIVKKGFLCFSPGVHTDRMAAKGVVHAELSLGTSRKVHVFCTHLQASYAGEAGREARAVRRKQVEELIGFMQKCVGEKSGCTANPQECNGNIIGLSTVDNEEALSLKRAPIVLAGDMNFDGRSSPSNGQDSDEYKEIVQKLRHVGDVNDIMKERLGEHPVTYADTTENGEPVDTVLTVPSDYTDGFVKQSLDYVFFFPGVEQSWQLEPDVEKARVEKFQISGKFDPEVPIVQLSDHYGLETVFKVG